MCSTCLIDVHILAISELYIMTSSLYLHTAKCLISQYKSFKLCNLYSKRLMARVKLQIDLNITWVMMSKYFLSNVHRSKIKRWHFMWDFAHTSITLYTEVLSNFVITIRKGNKNRPNEIKLKWTKSMTYTYAKEFSHMLLINGKSIRYVLCTNECYLQLCFHTLQNGIFDNNSTHNDDNHKLEVIIAL